MSNKTIFYKSSLTLISLLLIFNISMAQSNYQNECVNIENDGHITMKIWNPKKGKRYKIEQAQKDAIYTILYSGISSNKSCIPQKPILKNQTELKKFKKIETEFFKTKGVWLTYIHSSSVENALPEKIGEKDWKVYQVSVNRNLLKKYLEENEIIKPINTGF